METKEKLIKSESNKVKIMYSYALLVRRLQRDDECRDRFQSLIDQAIKLLGLSDRIVYKKDFTTGIREIGFYEKRHADKFISEEIKCACTLYKDPDRQMWIVTYKEDVNEST